MMDPNLEGLTQEELEAAIRRRQQLAEAELAALKTELTRRTSAGPELSL